MFVRRIRRDGRRGLRRALLSSVFAAGAVLLPTAGVVLVAPAQAQAPTFAPARFAIPAQPLSTALTRFADAANLRLLFPSALVAGLSSPGFEGTAPPDQVLARLLAGSGLTYRFTGADIVTIERAAAQVDGGAVQLAPVTVEGQAPANPNATIGNLPPEYAGGQVARGGRVGALGNRDLMDVPFSLTGYTEETIRNTQAGTIGDVVANDPAVRVGYGFGNFSEVFVIRGFPLFSDDIAIDGLYGNAPRQLVALEMYERVEVLKGANAFLNGVPPGSSGIGGAINLVPKRAGDQPVTRITGNYAQDTRLGGHVDIGRRFGRDDAFGVRVNAAIRDGETAIDNEDRYHHVGAVGFDFRGERTRVTLDGGTQRQRIEQGRPVVFVTAPSVPKPPSANSNYARPFTYSDLEDTFAQARVEYDIAPSLTTYAAAGIRKMREDGDYASPTVSSVTGTGTAGRLTVPREDQNESGQVGLRADITTGPVAHRLNLGATALHTANRNAFEFAASSPINIYNPVPVPRPGTTSSSGSFGNLPLVSETMLTSVFLSDTLSFYGDRAALTLGVRHQSLDIEGFNRTTFAQTSNYEESAVTPVVGLVVKPTSTLSLYANRIEGLAQGPTAPSTAANAGEIFPPFKSTQYEIGGKLDLGRFGASAALFQTTQPSGFTDPATNLFGVNGEQENRGVELLVFGEAATGLRLLGGVTLLDAKLVRTAGGTNNGKDAIGVPDYQANFGIEWDVPFLDRVTASARVLHTATQYLNASNTLEVPSWTRLDLGARMVRTISDQDVAFRVNIENATSEAYWASAQGGYLTQGNPFTLKFSVSLDL